MKWPSLLVVLLLLVGLTGCLPAEEFVPEGEIHVISREDGSGTRGAFTQILGLEITREDGSKWDTTAEEAAITNSTSVVMTGVAGDPGAIGYLSLGSLNPMVKALEINGVAPSPTAIKDGSYPVARPFLLATLGEQSPLTKDFMSFITSGQGQQIVEESGYVSVLEGDVFASSNPEGKIVIGGSSSVTPVIEKLKEAYLKENPNGTIEVQQSDSTTGMASVTSGIYDIGMSSRSLKESELAAGLVSLPIALDGIVVVVNNRSPLAGLSVQQVNDIFDGTDTHWNEVTQ